MSLHNVMKHIPSTLNSLIQFNRSRTIHQPILQQFSTLIHHSTPYRYHLQLTITPLSNTRNFHHSSSYNSTTIKNTTNKLNWYQQCRSNINNIKYKYQSKYDHYRTSYPRTHILLYTSTGVILVCGSILLLNFTYNKYLSSMLSLHHTNNGLLDTYEFMGYDIPIVVWGILALNISVFVAWQIPSFQTFMYTYFTCSAYGVLVQKRYITMLTACFSHASIGHLLFNCIAFATISTGLLSYIPQLNRSFITTQEFILFYLGACISSTIIGWLITAVTSRRGYRGIALSQRGLGASGAVFSLFAVSCILNPYGQYYILLIPYPIYAKTLLPCLVAFDIAGVIYNMFKHSPLGHTAHLGGVIFGLLYVYLYLRPTLRKHLEEEQKRRGIKARWQ